MFGGFGSRFRHEKTVDGVGRVFSSLQGECKDLRSLSLADQESFVRAVEEGCTAVTRVLKTTSSSSSSSSSVSALRVLVAPLCAVLRVRGVNWEQGAVAAAGTALVRMLALYASSSSSVTFCSSIRSDLLRAAAAICADRGHMLAKESQDALIACCVQSCSVALAVKETAHQQVDLENDDESRDGHGTAVAPAVSAQPGAGAAGLDCVVEALHCLASIARAKRKSHFVETHLKQVGKLSLEVFAKLVASVIRGESGAAALVADLQLLEALVTSAGPLFASEFGNRVQSLVSSLASVLTMPNIRGDEGSSAVVDGGFSSMSESGVLRLSGADKLRVHAMLLLSALASSCFKQLSNDMLLLVPYCNVAQQSAFFESTRSSLYYFVLHDPNHRVRMHAISLLLSLLKPSRGFFSAAMDQQSTKQTSFISLSQKLALTLRDLHAVVQLALTKEEDLGNRTLLLRLVPVLASVAPYDRLVENDITLLLPVLRQVWSGDPGVSGEQMMCVLGILRIKSELPAVTKWLSQFDLVRRLVAGVCLQSEPANVTAELCVVELCSRYSGTVIQCFFEEGLLTQLLSRRDVSADIIRAMTALGSALLSLQDDQRTVSFWNLVLGAILPRQGHLFSLSTHPSVSASIVTLLSNIAAVAWERQSSRVQLIVVAAVSGCAASNEPEIRLAAVRGMGQLLMLESLVLENGRFLADAHLVIEEVLRDCPLEKNEELRGWAFWALGNFAQALDLVLSQPSLELEQRDDVLAFLLTSFKWALGELGELSSSSSPVSDKIRCSCFRVVGKAGKRLEQTIVRNLVPSILQAIDIALGSKQKPKVRWNACNALALVLEGSLGACCDAQPALWRANVFGLLLELIRTSNNYKERIGAVSVLEANVQRAWFIPDAAKLSLVCSRVLLSELEQGKSLSKQLEKQFAEKYEVHLKTLLRTSLIQCGNPDHVLKQIDQQLEGTSFERADLGVTAD